MPSSTPTSSKVQLGRAARLRASAWAPTSDRDERSVGRGSAISTVEHELHFHVHAGAFQFGRNRQPDDAVADRGRRCGFSIVVLARCGPILRTATEERISEPIRSEVDVEFDRDEPERERSRVAANRRFVRRLP